MKYQSELIKEILDKSGHIKSTIHYQSECIEQWIEENKGAYPKLCDYKSEWLYYIFEKPIGTFPYETITDVTAATVNNVVPYAYRTAILKGKTDENLQSVKMPVLKTLNNQSNLFFTQKLSNVQAWRCIRFDTFIKAEIYVKADSTVSNTLRLNIIQNIKGSTKETIYTNDNIKKGVNVEVENVQFIGFHDGPNKIEENGNGNLLEPIETGKLEIIVSDKLIKLTVNGDVALRSNESVYDELDLLTGKLTQRIDEDGSVLVQEVVKTVELTCINEHGESVSFKPIEGTMCVMTNGTPIKPTVTLEVPVEAITQILMSFIIIVEE